MRERAVLDWRKRSFRNFSLRPSTTGESRDVRLRHEIGVRELHAFGKARRAAAPEDGDQTVSKRFAVCERLPGQSALRDDIDSTPQTHQPALWLRFENQNPLNIHTTFLRSFPSNVDVLRAANHQLTLPNSNLPRQFLNRRTRARSGINASSGDDGEESSGDEDLAVTHDGDDVFVWALGADAERVAEAMGDALDEVAKL